MKKNVGRILSRSIRLLTKDASQLNSVFRVLEPAIGKINERTKAQPTIRSRFGLRSQRPEWFRAYHVGFTLHYPSVHYGAEPFVYGTSCPRIHTICCS